MTARYLLLSTESNSFPLPSLFQKFAQSLLSKITPYIEPYQARVRQILQDYKIEQRTAELKSKAVELYKGYGVDKVAPRFVSAFVVGETAAAAQ